MGNIDFGGNNDAIRRLSSGLSRTASENPSEAAQMAANRRVNRKLAQGNSAGGPSSMAFATGRPRDPLFYWKQNNLPYEKDNHEQLKQLREYCSLLYESHPLISSCIDIYTQYPLQGAEIRVKDPLLQEFYEDLFFAEDGLNYKAFLQQLGRTYWTLGEAFPLGSFNESLGVWDGEELLNPDDVMVERSAFSKNPRFLIRLPHRIREIMTKREPRWEFEQLMQAYPELARYAGQDDMLPVSNILLQHLKFDSNPWALRGTPILMRAMRSVMQEEMLNSAMDAIADRMYTPLIIAKLGASATDLGTNVPWIATEDEQEAFMESMDAAMAADFRVLITNFSTQIEQVFGRENVPDFTADFERLEDRILQSFGLSKTMLAGASSGETYAADAMNRDMVSQTLTKYQMMIQRHFEQRARVVAEAQEHYDYDERNGKRYVKMEEVLEIDEESGEQRIIEQPKLLIPTLEFRTMSLTDEAAQREFLEALRAAGIPISMKTRLMATGIELDDEIEQSRTEQVELAVEEQETRKATYMALKGRGLPIPDDLRKDFDPKPLSLVQQDMGTDGGAMARTPMLGLDPTLMTPTLAPTQDDMGIPAPGVPTPGMPAMPVNADVADPGNGVPESDEQRGGMPKPAALFRQTERTRTAARAHSKAPEFFDNDVPLNQQQPAGQFADPKVLGVRKYLDVDPETFYEEAEDA